MKMFYRKTGINDDIELSDRSKSEPSTSRIEKRYAVCVRNAYKKYGIVNPVTVLEGFDMTVPEGSIYGLLGASGCGKTTILNCIIGYTPLDSGNIWVLGRKPYTKAGEVLGRRVGYMPQDTGLYKDLTIFETLSFFGQVFGMTKEKIKERCDYLIQLLMLPEGRCIIKELSNGEQRRASLASALLHEPELLILDEPTVGVDPFLRQIIWDHFIDITRNGSVTIIITTHYIEESRQAHLIGFMRSGCLMAEEAPTKIQNQFHTTSIEEVFLELSKDQNQKGRDGHLKVETNDPSCKWNWMEDETRNRQVFTIFNPMHLRALVSKQLIWLCRYKSLISFLLFIPMLSICLFCNTVGHEQTNVSLAVVNYEIKNFSQCKQRLFCDSKQLGCNYLNNLKRGNFILNFYQSEVEATAAVLKNEVMASITIRHNYSDALRVRINNWQTLEDWDYEYSNIQIFRDVSDKFLTNYFKMHLYETFQNFVEEYLEACNLNKRMWSPLVKFEPPIYGDLYPSYTNYALPGLLLNTIFCVSISLTAGFTLIERKEASVQRTFVIGIKNVDLLVTLFLMESTIMILQSILTMFCAFFVFDMTVKGSIVLASVFVFLTGFCGMTYGLFISSICNSDTATHVIATGSMIPVWITSGMFWTTEGMHPVLQRFCPYFPLTYVVNALRSVLQRSWGLTIENVYMGCVSIIGWTILFLILSFAFMKFRKF